MPFSAKHPVALQNSAKAIKRYLAANPTKLADVAHSLAVHREHYPHRGFVVMSPGVTTSPLCLLLQTAKPVSECGGGCPAAVWAFTGQGAQWAQMGKELLEMEPLVRERIEHFDELMASLANPPAFKLKGALRRYAFN